MLKKIIVSLAFILAFIVVCVAGDLISGRWNGIINTVNGDIGLVYYLKAEGEKLTGNIVTDQGAIPIFDGKVAGDSLSFKISFNNLIIAHEGKVVGDTLKMKLKTENNIIEARLTRIKTTIYNDSPSKSTIMTLPGQ